MDILGDVLIINCLSRNFCLEQHFCTGLESGLEMMQDQSSAGMKITLTLMLVIDVLS